jgi:transposase
MRSAVGIPCLQAGEDVKERTKAIHAKISNRMKDFLHKLSTRLVKEHGQVRA